MANIIRLGLSADGMKLPLFVGGMSRAAFLLSGTWAGTVRFEVSYDGVNFKPLHVTPFASGTAVSSATANGSWWCDVGNALVVRVSFTRTSGTVLAAVACSIDASYQDAFLASTSRFVNQTVTNTTNTVTVAAQANRAWRCRTLTITVEAAATWAAQPCWKILDGASSVLWAGDLATAAGQYKIELPSDPGIPGVVGGGVVGTVGNAMSVVVAAAGSGVDTNINAEIVPA